MLSRNKPWQDQRDTTGKALKAGEYWISGAIRRRLVRPDNREWGRRVHYEIARREIMEPRKPWQGIETVFWVPREATGRF